MGKTIYHLAQDFINGLVCLAKPLPETIDVPIVSMGLSCECSLKPIH